MRRFLTCLSMALSSVSCQVIPPIDDYAAFYDRQPETILVLPVINETTSAEASSAFQSTIASPLIQRGYYILPVLPTVSILQSEGIYEGAQLTNVPPQKFKELLGADAVMYITLHSWDTTYAVIASGVSVSMTYELVETETGETLWLDSAQRSVQSDSSGGLLSAIINAAITAASVEYVPLAQKANAAALTSLPAGPMNKLYEVERAKYMKIAERKAARRSAGNVDDD